MEKCTGCGLCLPECAYRDTIALKEVALAGGSFAKKAVISPSGCKGCGACVAVCEPRAIKINGWTLDQFDAMVDSLAGKD
ncbi:MAG: 4Fe-4S binding protein [Chloroflexi bacterium]|nr:4Fe-4S binding protein [Chloroflexota bacterium]